MIVNGRRLWIDSHVHAYADMSSGEPRFDPDKLMEVLDADPAHLVWIVSDPGPTTGSSTSGRPTSCG